MTIKLLLNASQEDDIFKVDNEELYTVKIIGTIESKQEYPTSFQFMIGDGTGSIECKVWIEKDSGDGEKYQACK